MNSRQIIVVILFLLMIAGAPVRAADLELKKGDRICFIGNALADRMQHDGWLESYIQMQLPDKELVFRNLGFAGDTVTRRPRHRGFDDPDTQLTRCKADVIFVFFGYNESFSSPDNFASALGNFIEDSRGKKYNGNTAPRLVIVSPIAHEDLKTSNLPDGSENNERLAAITEAMAAVAAEKKVPFIDIFTPSKALYQQSRKPLTINGVHLNKEGNRQIAGIIHKALFEAAGSPSKDAVRLKAVNAAVLDKNWYWFNRYRATDGNDVWGSRSGLKFNNQTNKQVMTRELEMLDAMTANRDKVIWAAAAGKRLTVDDSNAPKSLKVVTNHKGKNPDGSHTFLTAEQGIEKMTLAKGMEVNVFASEEQFPELVNPVQMAVDTRGRLWVAAWQTYPKWQPDKRMKDALLILPDENADGKADKAIVFARVHNPTAFEFWNGGVLVVSAPEILFLKDTDGDDRADLRIVMFGSIDSADTHHTANSFVYGPGGGIYYQRGVFHVSNVETPWGPAVNSTRSGMYRFNPRTFEFAFHAGIGPNPHGISFDYWGYHYATDGTSGNAFQVIPTSGGSFKMRKLLQKTVRPVPASGILSSSHFPARNNGNFLICNAIGFLGIKQYQLSFDNGIANGTAIENILSSKDPNFRPTDFEVGQDGALYVSDWANPIVGHMQHNIRDPNRDHRHGRIYRITVTGRPLQKPVKIDGAPIADLLELLKHPVNGIRYRTRIELSERDSKAVIAATGKWIKQFDAKKKEDAHHLTEALWLHQQHNIKNKELLAALLESPETHAQVAARTVRQYWEQVPAGVIVEQLVKGKSKDGRGLLRANHPGTRREEFDKVFDGDARTKWYVSEFPGLWITYTYSDGAKHKVSAYTITSANDTPGRDPKSWRLYGSNDGKKWIEVDKRTGENFAQRHQKRRFDVAKPGDYKAYKLSIGANHGASGTQLSEIELIE